MARDDDFVSRIGNLDYFEGADTGRLLAVITALAGELFQLKAEVRRLTLALAERGDVGPRELEAAGASAAMRDWLADEEKSFGREVYGPFLAPDRVINASAGMRES